MTTLRDTAAAAAAAAGDELLRSTTQQLPISTGLAGAPATRAKSQRSQTNRATLCVTRPL